MTKFQKAQQLVHFIFSIAYYRTHTNNEYFVDMHKTDIVSREAIKTHIDQHEMLKKMNS